MSSYFNIYEKIDSIDLTEFLNAAGIKDINNITWPKGKTYKVLLEGAECSVTTSFRQLGDRVDGDLDAYTALSTMMSREEVVERIHKEDPNGHTDADWYAHAEFLPSLPELTESEREQRVAFSAAVLSLLSDQKTIETLAECAPRKKNGLFHKGRIFKIGLTGFANSYDSTLIEIIGKAKEETKLQISIQERNTSPDELDAWGKDFISTYHEGLPISEALKAAFGGTQSRPKGKKIKPDLYNGWGDGSHEIDASGFSTDVDYTRGLGGKNLKSANDLLDRITKWIVDPEEIIWDGQYVSIMGDNGRIHEDCIAKIIESGAIPMRYRGNRKIESIDIVSLDYSTWKGRNKGLERQFYLSRLSDRANRLEYDSSKGKTTRIVTEQAFLKWCTEEHEAKYNLKNNEHLNRFGNDKIKFDKIDSKDIKYILNRILDQYARGNCDNSVPGYRNPKNLCCVVGSGPNAIKARNFIKQVKLYIPEQYKETVEWPYLILDDPDSEECLHAYHIAEFNKLCGIKPKVYEASDFISKFEIYLEFIKEEFKEIDSTKKDYYHTSVKIDKDIEKSMEEIENSGFVSKDTQRERVKSHITKVSSIDFDGKNFVLDSIWIKKDTPPYVYDLKDPDNPLTGPIMERGGLIKENVNGKTDYLIVDLKDQNAMTGARGRDALVQIEKGKPLKIITLANLKRILGLS